MLSVGSARIKYFESHFRLRLLAAADMAGQFYHHLGVSAQKRSTLTQAQCSATYAIVLCIGCCNAVVIPYNVKIGVSGL